MSSAAVQRQTSRPTGDTIQRAAPSIRPFRDPDAGMLRCATLIADTDEWGDTGQRVRIFRNGQHHFAVCEVSATGKPHRAITRMVPDARGIAGTSLIVSLASDQIDLLLEAIR